MRTREEQASVLMQVVCDAGWKSSDAYDLAMREIMEAERRAERHVRAEIAKRVSALFDSYDAYDRPCKQFVMEAIDAAREVKE